jgi:hypothetical protein
MPASTGLPPNPGECAAAAANCSSTGKSCEVNRTELVELRVLSRAVAGV